MSKAYIGKKLYSYVFIRKNKIYLKYFDFERI